MHIAIKFAYDGRSFHGYARQPNLKTVEGELIKSLVKHGFINNAKNSLFRSASRTDKGVSALGNVASFNTGSSINQIIEILSDTHSSIIVYGKKEVEADFNPRHANQRKYRYYLPTYNLDVEKIASSLPCFIGEHNFSNFARLESFKDPIRTIDSIETSLEEDRLIIDFSAQTFLWHQIRRIISALIQVGKGNLEKEQITEALDKPEKKVDYGLAPPHPLILMGVDYNFDFEYDKKTFNEINLLKERIGAES